MQWNRVRRQTNAKQQSSTSVRLQTLSTFPTDANLPPLMDSRYHNTYHQYISRGPTLRILGATDSTSELIRPRIQERHFTASGEAWHNIMLEKHWEWKGGDSWGSWVGSDKWTREDGIITKVFIEKSWNVTERLLFRSEVMRSLALSMPALPPCPLSCYSS